MKVFIKLPGLLLLSILFFAAVRCIKKSSGKEEISGIQRAEFIALLESQLHTKGTTISVYPDKGETRKELQLTMRHKDARINSFCAANFDLDITQYDLSVQGTCGGGWTNYTGKIYFTISKNNAYPPPTDPAQIATDWFITESGNVTGPHTIPFSYVGNNRNDYFYVTDAIDFAGLGVNYCDATVIDNEMIIPPTNCPAGSTPVSVVHGFSLTLGSFSRCKTIYPVSVSPNTFGPGSFAYSGWATLCTPCHFYPPQQFELQYRLQGTSTWTTVTQNYFGGGPYPVTGLSAGTYEYRHRNKMNTPDSCYGPYSNIKTVIVS